MVTRLLLSLRKAIDPRTKTHWNVDHFSSFRAATVATRTRDHTVPQDTWESSVRVDSVLGLSDFGSQDERNVGISDGEA